MQSGQAGQACALLQPLLADRDADLELHFLVGQCLAATGHNDEAMAQFRLVLARQPNALRARAELATLEAKGGDSNAARADLQRVLSAGPPAAVRPGLEQQLAHLGGSKEWTIQAAAGALFDSNVTAGPSVDQVTLFSLPFLVTDNARRQGDWAGLANLSLDYFHPEDAAMGIGAGIAVHTVTYASLNSFNLDSITAYVGPTLHVGHGIVSAGMVADYALLAGKSFSNDIGGLAQYLEPLRNDLVFSEQLRVRANEFYTASDFSGSSGLSTTSVQWFYEPGGAFVQPKILLGYDHGRANFHSDHQWGLSIGAFQPIGNGFSGYIEPGWRQSSYQALDPAFASQRHDADYSLTANLGYDLTMIGFNSAQAVLGYTWTDDSSNQALYDYRRHQIFLQISKSL